MIRRGIFIARPGKSVAPNSNQYESDKPHLQINLGKTPAHMEIVNLYGGTSWGTTGVPTTQTETLLTIPHNLSYVPEVLIYFYVVSYAGSTSDTRAGRYSANMGIIAGGSIMDLLYASVDDTNMYIKHELEDYMGGTGYTSDAAQWYYRIKYFITSNDSHVSSYTTKGY